MMPLRSWLAIISLSVLAALIFTGLERLEKNSKRQTQIILPPVDYEFRDVAYSALNRKGEMRLALSASSVSHLRDTETLQVQAPLVRRMADGDAAHILRAERAEIFRQGERVELVGHVEMKSAARDQPPLYLKTAFLTLLPESRTATTEATVNIQQKGTTLSGKGLVANFGTEEMEIKQNVEARYLAIARR